MAPLIQLTARGRNMPEVSVIEHAAALLLHHGSPYALTAQQALRRFLRYDPYLPVMTIFGLPHALAGGNDLPVIGLLCLGLALAAGPHPGQAEPASA